MFSFQWDILGEDKLERKGKTMLFYSGNATYNFFYIKKYKNWNYYCTVSGARMTSCTSGILHHVPQRSRTFHTVSECSTTFQNVPQCSHTSLERVAQSISLIYFLVIIFTIEVFKGILVPKLWAPVTSCCGKSSCLKHRENVMCQKEKLYRRDWAALVVTDFGFSSWHEHHRWKKKNGTRRDHLMCKHICRAVSLKEIFGRVNSWPWFVLP